MKQFIKEWVLTPKTIGELLKIKDNLMESYDKKLFSDKLRGIEKGKRCFIVGTGSSIKQQDLSLLRDEIVIGVSGLYNHDDINILNPKYYINPPIFKSHSKYYDESEFINYLKDMDSILSDNTIMFFHIGDKKYFDIYNLFNNKKIIFKNYIKWNNRVIKKIDLRFMPSVWSVSESAIQTALYLGFDKIYLLGFDHDWFNGPMIYAFDIDKARKHFGSSVEEVSKKHNIDSEFQMIRHAQIFSKYKKLYEMKENIFNANANQNSYVDIFPKVKYESLFNK